MTPFFNSTKRGTLCQPRLKDAAGDLRKGGIDIGLQPNLMT
jgi:hypothetical protein